MPKRSPGPLAVQNNLLAGMRQVGHPVRVNPQISRVTPWVGVLSDPKKTLPWAIEAKKTGFINRLVAGPNLVATPDQNEGILTHPAIDVVITPSQWVSDFYKKLKPELSDRIVIWPVGINEEYWSPALDPGTKQFDFLVYNKIQKPKYLNFVDSITDYLQGLGLKIIILNYGYYLPGKYRRLLHSTRALLFLSESESQGLALFESWSCNIPTLVWDRHFWEYKGYQADGSSAPYLTELCGLSFPDLAHFTEMLDKFINNLNTFKPREYILNNFNLAKAAKAYIQLFYS